MKKSFYLMLLFSVSLLGCGDASTNQSDTSAQSDAILQGEGQVGFYQPSDTKCCDCSEEVNSWVKACGKGCDACETGKPEACECKANAETADLDPKESSQQKANN